MGLSVSCAAAQAPTSDSVPPGQPVLKMEQVTVTENASGAEAAFASKVAGDTSVEIVSGGATKNATAQSASDLLKNTSGVTVNRGVDGASRVSIRGMDSRFTRVTVDGQRQGGTGNSLDNLPPEIVQSIEISKAATPDQDADAIGGAINVTTSAPDFKAAHEQGRHQIVYNSLAPHPGGRNTLGVSRPFAFASAEPNAAILVSASFDDTYRQRDQWRSLREWTTLVSPGPAPFTGTLVPVLTQGRIDSAIDHRRRTGLVLNADVRFGATAIFWRGNYTRDETRRNRRLDDFDPALGRPVELAPDHGVIAGVTQNRREQTQDLRRDALNFMLGAKSVFGVSEWDGTLGASFTEEKEPRSLDAVFRSERTYRTSYDLRTHLNLPALSFVDETNAVESTGVSDPASYRFKSLDVTRTATRDRELAAKLNVKIALDDAAATFLKFGGKLQERHRAADTDRESYDPGAQPLSMTGLVGSANIDGPPGGFHFGPVPDAAAVAALLTQTPAAFQFNARDSRINSATADSTATETIWSGYGMARTKRGRWTLLGGLRAEGTRVVTAGNQIAFGPGGLVTGITPIQATRTYWEALPGLHARFDPFPTLVLRGSVTRSLARPSYGELAPSRQLTFADRRARTGNPDLKPYAATNFDLSADRYSAVAGLFSAGVFFKKIDHFIADAQFPVSLGELGTFYDFKRINGDTARVWGLETSWQSIAWKLPGGLGNGSVQANYTYYGSETRFPGRPGETFPLVDQVRHQVALTLRDERGPLSLEATVRYRSKMLEDINAPGMDNMRSGYFDAEVNATYKLSKALKFTFGVANLFDTPTHNYSGELFRVNEHQAAGVDVSLGVQWKR
ncbi:MAG: TonB-dependent receptor [Verrucomicrobiota bacterium]